MALRVNRKHYRKLMALVAAHPFVPTDEIRRRLLQVADFHLKHEDDKQEQQLGISPCTLISLMREVLLYRNRYGLIEATTEKRHTGN